MNEEGLAWVASGVPTKVMLGLDGLPYLQLPNEFEVEDYLSCFGEVIKDHTTYCVGGFHNALRLSATLGL